MASNLIGMVFISTPLAYRNTDSALGLERSLNSQIELLDNLIELIIFTPRGSFLADPEFGFEYWNHEYSNIQYSTFNSGQSGMLVGPMGPEVTKSECQESIRRSLLTYAPQLKNVNVEVQLDTAFNKELHWKGKVQSKHLVSINIEGEIDSGISTDQYSKRIEFLMEPTAKRRVQY